MILAVHSSPFQDGNLERMVKRTAQASGHRYELISLSELNLSPCRGCACCATGKRCVQEDDIEPLYDKLETMDGLILGGVNYNGRFNSLVHIFLERLFPFYHQEPVFLNRPAAVVAVGGTEPERAAQDMTDYLKVYFFQVIGTAVFASDTPPCFSCGLGTKCQVGMPALHWSSQEFEEFTKVEDESFQRFEDNADAVQGCERLGRTLRTAIDGKWSRPRTGGGFYLPASG